MNFSNFSSLTLWSDFFN